MIDSDRALFIANELDLKGYTRKQADRARIWIIYGDWRMRGADPTLEMSDFFPDDEQYLTTLQRISPRMASQVTSGNERTIDQFEDYKRRYIQNDGFMH